jgi:hypothetical protein
VKFYSTEAAPAICWSRLGWRGGTSQSTFEMGKRHATEHTHLRLARLCRERTRRGGVSDEGASSAVRAPLHFAKNVGDACQFRSSMR